MLRSKTVETSRGSVEVMEMNGAAMVAFEAAETNIEKSAALVAKCVPAYSDDVTEVLEQVPAAVLAELASAILDFSEAQAEKN